MKVVYKESFWKRVLDATTEAAKQDKQIDHIELTPGEVVECYREFNRGFYYGEELTARSLHEFASTNSGKCFLYGARLTWP